MMQQSKLESFLEVCVSTLIGFLVSMVANYYVLPTVGCHPTTTQNVIITVVYTVISIVRSYWVRRLFNAGLHRVISEFSKRMVALHGNR